MPEKISYEFKPRTTESKKRFSKKHLAVLIAVLALAIFSIAFIASPLTSLFKNHWGLGVFIADQSGHTDHPDAQVTDNGIKVKLTTAVAGNDRVVLSLNFSGFTDAQEVIIREQNSIAGDVFLSSMGFYDGCRLLPANKYAIIFEGAIKNTDNSYTENYEFTGQYRESQQVHLHIAEVLGVKGEWNIYFEMTYTPSRTYVIDKEFEIPNGKIHILNVIVDSISTTIEVKTDVDYYDYLMSFVSDDEHPSINNFTGVSRAKVEERMLSDGSMGYVFITTPVLEGATFTIRSSHLDHLDEEVIHEFQLS